MDRTPRRLAPAAGALPGHDADPVSPPGQSAAGRGSDGFAAREAREGGSTEDECGALLGIRPMETLLRYTGGDRFALWSGNRLRPYRISGSGPIGRGASTLGSGCGGGAARLRMANRDTAKTERPASPHPIAVGDGGTAHIITTSPPSAAATPTTRYSVTDECMTA